MRFLIVDDSPVIRLVLQRILSTHGECELAVDGESAVEAHVLSLAEGRPFDLICLDVGLPRMSGIEVLAAVRKLEAEKAVTERTRIIVITASAESGSVETAIENGADGYLVKPVNKDQLLEYFRKFGLPGSVESSPTVDKSIESVTAMCAADQLPVVVMANLIRLMGESISRQSAPTGAPVI